MGNTEVLAHFPPLLGLVEPGIYYLRTPFWVEVNSENDFSAALAVARMLLQVTGQDWSPLAKLLDRSGEVRISFSYPPFELEVH